MIEPGTGLTILGTAVGGAKVVEKILGPTSEYIGEQIKSWTTKRVDNISNIFKNAEEKLGKGINSQGYVSPKVLKSILDDGSWCEEDLQVEYFGGVLASSRTGISRDDRGAYYTSLISKLTTYQLRTHYLFYHCLKTLFSGQNININDGNNWRKLDVFLTFDTYYNSMDYVGKEVEEWQNLMSHSIWGLHKEDLISDFKFGSKDNLIQRFQRVTEGGIIFRPSKLGVELFMWAYGYGQKNPNEFFDPSVAFNDTQSLNFKAITCVVSDQIADN